MTSAKEAARCHERAKERKELGPPRSAIAARRLETDDLNKVLVFLISW